MSNIPDNCYVLKPEKNNNKGGLWLGEEQKKQKKMVI